MPAPKKLKFHSKRGKKNQVCSMHKGYDNPNGPNSAWEDAERLRKKDGTPMMVWKCKICGKWHCGRTNKIARRAMMARRGFV